MSLCSKLVDRIGADKSQHLFFINIEVWKVANRRKTKTIHLGKCIVFQLFNKYN
jgi:hypothetical protein